MFMTWSDLNYSLWAISGEITIRVERLADLLYFVQPLYHSIYL